MGGKSESESVTGELGENLRQGTKNQQKENNGNDDGHQQAGKLEQAKQESAGNEENGPTGQANQMGRTGVRQAVQTGEHKCKSHSGENSRQDRW